MCDLKGIHSVCYSARYFLLADTRGLARAFTRTRDYVKTKNFLKNGYYQLCYNLYNMCTEFHDN